MIMVRGKVGRNLWAEQEEQEADDPAEEESAGEVRSAEDRSAEVVQEEDEALWAEVQAVPEGAFSVDHPRAVQAVEVFLADHLSGARAAAFLEAGIREIQGQDKPLL